MINVPHNGTATSRHAAQTVSAYEDQRGTILAALREAGVNGLTRQELGARTGISGDAIRPRVWQLIKDGAIEESGEVRQTESGKPAMVLVLK